MARVTQALAADSMRVQVAAYTRDRVEVCIPVQEAGFIQAQGEACTRVLEEAYTLARAVVSIPVRAEESTPVRRVTTATRGLGVLALLGSLDANGPPKTVLRNEVISQIKQFGTVGVSRFAA